MSRHFYIPDPQVHPDVPMDHLEAAGNAILEYRPDVIIHITVPVGGDDGEDGLV